jgi:hypothetical protein
MSVVAGTAVRLNRKNAFGSAHFHTVVTYWLGDRCENIAPAWWGFKGNPDGT